MTTQVWIYWVAGVVIGGLGAALVGWALFADRLNRGSSRRRCPKCWYDMASVVGLKCPECGRIASLERKLFRTRRRWGWGIVGFVAIVAAFGLDWYAAGRVLGWTRVMPLWMQVRLVPIIPENDILTQNAWYSTKSLSLDQGTAARLQEIALGEIEKSIGNPKTPAIGAQPAAYALTAIKEQITDRERVGKVLLRAACENPGMMHHCAGKLAGTLLGQEAYFVETAEMIKRGVASGQPVAGQSIVPFMLSELTLPCSDHTAVAVADVVLAEPHQGVTYPQLTGLIQERPAAFFGRLLERFRAGDKNERGAVLWLLRANVRSPVLSEPSYFSICREACAMLDDDDPAVREQGTLLIVSFFPDVIAPVFPELGALLSSEREWTRRYARTCLVNVKVNRDADEDALISAVCEALRTGRDRGRSLALEILILRKQSLRAGVADALLDAIERTQDPDLADQLARQYCAIGAAQTLFPFTCRSDERLFWEKMEQRLVAMLDRGGAHTRVACNWFGRIPMPAASARARLGSLSRDAARPASDRAAARDALLRIRDRTNPDVSVLEPLN